MKCIRHTLAHGPAIAALVPHKIICCLLFSLCLFSCKKEGIDNYTTIQDPINLALDQVINDSTLVFKWTKFTGRNFQKYQLTRGGYYFKNGVYGFYTEVLDESTDPAHVNFTENKMPFTKFMTYGLFVYHADTSLSNHGFSPSDEYIYDRPNSYISDKPRDVIYDKEKDQLFVTQDKTASLVACSNSRVLVSVTFPASLGYCSKGDFNGTAEYYVPSNDGWINILDAITLQVKDKIFVGGYRIGSVVAAHGILYVSSQETSAAYTSYVKVYDRATKNFLVSRAAWSESRLLPLEGRPEVELIDMVINQSSRAMTYYHFSNEGALVNTEGSSYADYQYDPAILRSFPDGSKFISASSGAIFDKSIMRADQTIDRYAYYSDFAFNTDGTIIYAAKQVETRIEAIAYPALNKVKDYPTTFRPYKIFRNGNTIISAGMTLPGQPFPYLIIEKIEL